MSARHTSQSGLLTRRQVLRSASLAAGGLTILRSAKSAKSFQANEQLRLAIFGSMYNAEHFFTSAHQYDARIVALCNPDRRKLPDVFKKFQAAGEKLAAANNTEAAQEYKRLSKGDGAMVFQDIRRMFEEAGDQFDALVVSIAGDHYVAQRRYAR